MIWYKVQELDQLINRIWMPNTPQQYKHNPYQHCGSTTKTATLIAKPWSEIFNVGTVNLFSLLSSVKGSLLNLTAIVILMASIQVHQGLPLLSYSINYSFITPNW